VGESSAATATKHELRKGSSYTIKPLLTLANTNALPNQQGPFFLR
jgi:hypothetical protein